MERLTFAASGQVIGRTLRGVAHAYGQVTVDGRKHSFAPGVFAQSIAAGKVKSFAFHDDSKLLGSQKAGTVKLRDGKDGLEFEIELPETSYADDLRKLVDRGEDLGMSFQFSPGKSTRKGETRIFTAGELISVDPVAMPAFEGTSVILNSADDGEPTYSTVIKIRARALAGNVIVRGDGPGNPSPRPPTSTRA